jgi:ketosteroid isomerase-like protein
MAEAARDFVSAWEDLRTDADEYRELEDEQVLVLDHRSGRGKTSGLELSQIRTQGAHLFHIRDGRVTRLVRYMDRDRALADLGLAPGGRPSVTTSANVELFRAFGDALNALDIEAMLAYCDPNIELHSGIGAIQGVYHGHDGLRRWHRDNQEVWGEEIRAEPEAVFDLGEHTLAFYVAHGRGLRSGVEVATPQAAVVRWRDGLITYIKGYRDREDAMRDLGVTRDELEPIEP